MFPPVAEITQAQFWAAEQALEYAMLDLHLSTVEVHWFRRAWAYEQATLTSSTRLLGWAWKPDQIWVNKDQTINELTDSICHECKHLAQSARRTKEDRELEATLYGRAAYLFITRGNKDAARFT